MFEREAPVWSLLLVVVLVSCRMVNGELGGVPVSSVREDADGLVLMSLKPGRLAPVTDVFRDSAFVRLKTHALCVHRTPAFFPVQRVLCEK